MGGGIDPCDAGGQIQKERIAFFGIFPHFSRNGLLAEFMQFLDMAGKNLWSGKMVNSGFMHFQGGKEFMAYGTAEAEKMDRPVGGQGLVDVGNLRVDQQPLAFGDDGALAVYDKFPLSFDAVEPLVKGHPVRAADGLLPVVYSNQL